MSIVTLAIIQKNTQIMTIKYMKEVKIHIFYVEHLSSFEDISNLSCSTKKILYVQKFIWARLWQF